MKRAIEEEGMVHRNVCGRVQSSVRLMQTASNTVNGGRVILDYLKWINE
jgi:hypothetical protein